MSALAAAFSRRLVPSGIVLTTDRTVCRQDGVCFPFCTATAHVAGHAAGLTRGSTMSTDTQEMLGHRDSQAQGLHPTATTREGWSMLQSVAATPDGSDLQSRPTGSHHPL